MAHSFGLYGDGIHFWLFVANHSDLESFLVVHTLLQQDGYHREGFWEVAGHVADSSDVKNLPAMRETRVRSLSREDPLEEGTATHSSILAREIPRTEDPGGLQSVGSQRVGQDRATNTGHVVSPLDLS